MSNDYYVVSGDSLRDVADTIRTKGGTSAQLEYPDDWKDAINAISGGGAPIIQALTVTENGTYTAPSGVDGYSPVTVSVSGGGDEPIPDDGKTRIWIHFADETPNARLQFLLRFTSSIANNTTIDWGDGTTEVKGSTSATNYSHTYSQGGDYVITMTVNSGTISFDGTSGNSGQSIYGHRAATSSFLRCRIKKIVFGDNVTTIGGYSCYYCYALASVVISDDVTSIGTYAFRECYALMSIALSDGITSIGGNAFYGCYSLTSIIIPESVSSIGASAFYNCYGILEYHFKSATPPSLADANAFTNLSNNCIIYVPQGSLSAYQQATNWSIYASHIQEEPT